MHGSAQPESSQPEFAQPEDRLSSRDLPDAMPETEQAASLVPGGDPSNGNRTLDETELDSALQLLVERAQYITGATGAALALPQADEMVCRASAGTSAPAIGARLQVRSGLTGESIARRQLLRCDNAEADPRVNLEACWALGIASIVVLPLLRRNGEVRGLFELFSDHPYAFEERDLIALERMAALTSTALDLADQRQNFGPAVTPPRGQETRPAPSAISAVPDVAPGVPVDTAANLADPKSSEPPILSAEPADASPDADSTSRIETVITAPVDTQLVVAPLVVTAPMMTHAEPEPLPAIVPAPVPEAMRRVQKCSACGFPVSEGRTLCLDCEKKDSEKKELEKKRKQLEEVEKSAEPPTAAQTAQGQDSSELSPVEAGQEIIPAFLANSAPPQESWLADHVNLLAIIVLILGILVAVVVFR